MAQGTTLSGVLFVTRHRQSRATSNLLHSTDMDRVLVELRMALSMTIDIFPCLRVGEGEFIRHETDDGAVLVVKLLDFEGPAAAVETPHWEDGGDLAEEGSWVFG